MQIKHAPFLYLAGSRNGTYFCLRMLPLVAQKLSEVEAPHKLYSKAWSGVDLVDRYGRMGMDWP